MYAKVDDPEKGIVMVGTGTDAEFYKSIGMEIMDVEKGYDNNWYLAGMAPARVYTLADYENALEEHIRKTREARGYTTREPDTYKDSSVPRWRQDALDYIAFRDACMLYGLEVMNTYAAGGVVPDLEEFIRNLPEITWTYVEG